MTAIRFFTDDVYGTIAPALRRAGFDAVSTPESGRLGEPDLSQLQWAIAQQRVLVTFNVADFAALHCKLLRQGGHHRGIIVADQLPIGDLLRRLFKLAHAFDGAMMEDRLEFLSNW